MAKSPIMIFKIWGNSLISDFLKKDPKGKTLGSFLRVKLPYLREENQRRKDIANAYLKGINNSLIELPKNVSDHNSHVWHLFVIRTSDRNGLSEFLKDNGVSSMIHYPIPPHKQEALNDYNFLSLPITERIHDEVLSLPISPVMTDEEVSTVIRVINEYK